MREKLKTIAWFVVAFIAAEAVLMALLVGCVQSVQGR